jgi:iron(III) transport system permease protein
VKQTFLSGATLAALVMLVALPLVFILLQAIFPRFSAGSLGDSFGGIPALLADPQLPAMLGGTLWIAAGVALVSVMIGLPLGILRGMFSLPLPRLWDLLFLIPFLTPPYISALSWMLALQSQGYLQQLTGWQLNDLLFSRSGIVLVMTFNIFPVVYFAVSRSLLASGTRLAVVARPWRQRLARLLARDATDALSGAGGGDAAGVYPRHRGVWRTGGAGQPGGSGDADGRY